MGIIDEDDNLADALNNDNYNKLRHELLTGIDLNDECARCSSKPLIKIKDMQEWVKSCFYGS